MKKQSRSEARTEAFKLIFQMSMHKDMMDEQFDILIEETPECLQNIEYIREVVYGVMEHEDSLRTIIERNLSRGWRLSRISKPALCILLLAVYEMQYVSDVPETVAINEAVELTKKYDEPERAAFVNGVLGGVMKELHVEEPLQQ